MTAWVCLECGSANPPANLICGSAMCQERRLREVPRQSRSAPAIAPANGEVAGPVAVVGGEILDLEVQESNPSTRRNRHYYPPKFEEFWSEYPRKDDKIAALRAWKRVSREVDADVLREAATRYRNNPKRDPDYTKYAERWLNAGSYLDEGVDVVAPPPSTDDRYRPYDPEERDKELDEAIRRTWAYEHEEEGHPSPVPNCPRCEEAKV